MTFALASRLAPLAALALGAPLAAAGQSMPVLPFAARTLVDQPLQSAWLAQGTLPQSGQVVITEFMKDPTYVSDTHGEWIEVWNSLPWRCNLDGWTLSDDAGNSHTLDAGGTIALIMRPGQRFVLGLDGDTNTNGGVVLNYVYSGFSMTNSGADQIILTKPNGQLVDRVEFDNVSYPHTPGHSIQLDEPFRTQYYNDDPAHWCHSQTLWSAGNPDTGTPGFLNDPCQ